MPSKAKAIMMQGTMSNAGKSFIAAALCRIFMQDGYSCAPFKSQNMALNSYVTDEGLEIGRAQAMQAEAAGIKPSVYMNPILLKPNTDTGSQVIVMGKARGDMKAADYFRYKKKLIPDIMNAYNALAEKHDIIVIEGAGSPCELNLKSDDIVNMGMAKLADAPVLLVGDIDRGGIFPQLLGTVSLLEEDERERVKGLVVNRFRGDINVFRSGTDILTEKSGIPVAGVVPFINCDIEEEDSLSDKLQKKSGNGIIDIAVIHLPKISNYTDFDVFSQYDGVSVRYVSAPESLGNPDIVFIPGTKSTSADMKWLRDSGMETVIKSCAERNIPLFGICGGYQILGEEISEETADGDLQHINGMGLLSCRTNISAEKKLCHTSGHFADIEGILSPLSGAEFKGYEIHMGETENNDKKLLTTGGAYRGNVYGSYIHGIFDSPDASERLVRLLFERRGLSFRGTACDRKAYKESQFDLLADAVRKSLDMELIYRILGMEKKL